LRIGIVRASFTLDVRIKPICYIKQ